MNAELLTVSQTAQYLQLSEKTIRRMIGSGTLPASKLGNHTWRIRAQDVDEYVASSRQNKAVSEKAKPLNLEWKHQNIHGLFPSFQDAEEWTWDSKRRVLISYLQMILMLMPRQFTLLILAK